MPKTYRHKEHGWTRTFDIDLRRVRVTPNDGSGDRLVEFLGAGSWSNNPNDDRANINRDRIVLCDGAPLPPWAVEWLTRVNARECQNGRDALAAAIHDADDNFFGRDSGW